MQLTLRLEDDQYLDVIVDLQNRTLILISPIPNISLDSLMKISDELHWKIALPITDQIIEPEQEELPIDEIEQYYTPDTESAVSLLLSLCNIIISE